MQKSSAIVTIYSENSFYDTTMVITLGPQGTYSSMATAKLFPKEKIIYEQNFYSIFEKLMSKGGTAVLPLENSTQGTIREVWDFLYESDFFLWHTVELNVSHCLGAKNTRFNKIISHPQAFTQSKKYILEHYPKCIFVPADSTAHAVVVAKTDQTYAAIAAEEAFIDSGLKILKKHIETNHNNTTVFGVIAKHPVFTDKSIGKMSIVIAPKVDKAGLLFALLKPFKNHRVNLTRIESRASGKKLGQYIFFVDFIGNSKNKAVISVIKNLSKLAKISVIGEY